MPLWRRSRPSSDPDTPPAEDAATKAATDRLESDPWDQGALVILGAYFLSRGHAEKALECLHRVTRVNPRYPGIWWIKAKAFDALGDAMNADACRTRAASLARRGEA